MDERRGYGELPKNTHTCDPKMQRCREGVAARIAPAGDRGPAEKEVSGRVSSGW